MKRIALICVVLLALSILIVGKVCKNLYEKIPEDAIELVERNKKEMLTLAEKQVDSLFENGDTNIFPIYFGCKPRFLEGNPWKNSGTAFREILYNTNYENRLPKDIISTYHFAPENPVIAIGKDFLEGIKMEIKLNSKNENKAIHGVNWKGFWQSGWALGVNERWGSEIVQYIIIPYAISFRKPNSGILGDYYTVESALDSSYKFLIENPNSDFKNLVVQNTHKFLYDPIINNEYYYLIPKKVDNLIPRLITDSPAYDHSIANDYYRVFIRALGIKKYELVFSKEHVEYLKEGYIEKERQAIIDFSKKVCGALSVLLVVFLFVYLREYRREKVSFLQRMIKLCNPKQFIDNYDKEKLEIANNIYNQAIKINENDSEAVISLSKSIEDNLCLYVISSREIKELKDKSNPKHFMKPYDSVKINRANEIYAKLSTERLRYSEYLSFQKQISELYNVNGVDIPIPMPNVQSRVTEEFSSQPIADEKGSEPTQTNRKGNNTKTASDTIRYDFGVYDERCHEEDSRDVVDSFVAAIKIVTAILITAFAIIVCMVYLRAVAIGWILSVIGGIFGVYLVKKLKGRKEGDGTKRKRSPKYYIGLVVYTISLLFICFLLLRAFVVRSINEPYQNTVDRDTVPTSDNNYQTKSEDETLENGQITPKDAIQERRYNKRLKEIQTNSVDLIDDKMKQQIQDLLSEFDD